MTYSVVWFKRDLRLDDHAALHRAAGQGPVLCLYVIEPSFWRQPDAANQHYQFILECLSDLAAELRRRGGVLHVVTGEVVEVLECLYRQAPFTALHSHEETGNDLTYRRDRAVARWCRDHGVPWHETPQFGVIRRLDSRDAWQAAWETRMAAPRLPVPAMVFSPIPWPDAPPPGPADLGLDAADPPLRQAGGRRQGLAILDSFLDDRSGRYRGGLSSPLSAPTACSRLSPYLAQGAVSLREVVQATRRRLADLPDGPDPRRQGLAAFLSRLHWHCHFIQKLESEPALEWRNLHPGYDGLREGEWNEAHFQALVAGRTGWPLVDACVAMLRETGWINFRMRAMLVSVAAYPLWLHWRPVGLWLARQFLDYEPGIHWSQMQMQSGTTGMNTTRVYNPLKQARDHDPQGRFVRRWLPALRRVPDSWLFEPWRMPPEVQDRCGVRVGRDVPLPIVDLETATRAAKARVHGLRAQPAVKAVVPALVDRHGSRKPAAPRSRPRPVARGQLSLDL
ncbi:FAD-binding domain-containing protein [Nitrospirillum amazonense]|uniref:Deoxyribodipyrimidine photo-lyase family protein (Cryptochrome) n=1 Tax=Nitrospirillum amazonense TaxID=28077 RepID=A0A560JC27_9PROT|nr:FAD-binding domain-containing protein [Nitrospirillum amazonense]MDG3439943.1 FAD-binding domain-containing protein [Nitrospirillum amazonense]TWB68758.1 deoxyribodipyrimidine photo-lyase family protein (cryptochrome) [Nitrospirillum amazonense]